MNDIFIESSDILSLHVTDLFNAIFSSGFFPDQWTEGIVIPLHKKNDPCNVNNYRGITLGSCFSKIFTSILNRRLSLFVESNDILSDAQFGFRPGRSTIDASFILYSIIQKLHFENKRLYAAFIDLKKAFDSVYRNGLWYKLFHLGVNGKMLRIIRDMYSKVKSFVKVNNLLSECFESKVGLKQGEVISPLLFALFVDDLELYLQGKSCGLNFGDIQILLLLFADDMVLLSDDPSDLQNSLNALCNYCNKWGLEVNAEKSKIVVFRKRGPLRRNESWTYDNISIEVVNDFNYMGTVFTYTGSFLLNQKMLADKALKAMNVLCNKTRSFDFDISTLFQLFDAFVGSILNFSSEIWGMSKSKEIERVHLKFCKKTLGVKSSTCTSILYSELNRYPLYINRYSSIIKYWGKILFSNNLIISTMYNALLAQSDRGASNWCSNVKSLLFQYGFAYVWFNPHSVNLKTFHVLFKKRVIDEFTQNLDSSINNGSFTIYRFIRTPTDIQHYLKVLPKKWRTHLAKFRLSSHQLRIETGRYGNNRVERSLRICICCDKNEIEDEYYFLLVCPAYVDLRAAHIKKYFYKRPNMFKFVKLSNLKNRNSLLNLAKFIKQSFSRRSEIINNSIE